MPGAGLGYASTMVASQGAGRGAFAPASFGYTSPSSMVVSPGRGSVATTPASGVAVEKKEEIPSCPILATHSVRFARNHDTVHNDFFADLGGIDARVVWAWLLAVHDGTVLVYADDVFSPDSAELIKQAVTFRRRMAGCAFHTKVCLRYKQSGGFAVLLMIVLLSKSGATVGVCLVNLLKDSNLRLDSIPAGCRIEGKFEHEGKILNMKSDGVIRDVDATATKLDISPLNAVFLVPAERTLTLKVSRKDVDWGLKPVFVVCGDSEEMGAWNPKSAPKMKPLLAGPLGAGHEELFHISISATVGVSFKYVVLYSNDDVQWEENRPNRSFPEMGDDQPHYFNRMDSEKGSKQASSLVQMPSPFIV
jgi:hypothetical protein